MFKSSFFVLLLLINCFLCIVQSFPGEITFDRIETIIYDNKAIEYYNARVTKFNRTTYVINAEFKNLISIDETWDFNFKLFKYEGGEYRKFMSKTVLFCDYITNDKMGIWQQVVDSSNMPPRPNYCPIPANIYYFKELMASYNVPVLMTNKKWKLEALHSSHEKPMFQWNVFFEISQR